MSDADVNRRLDAALAKPPRPVGDDAFWSSDDHFDPWEDLICGVVGPYNPAIDALAIDCLCAVQDRTTFDLLASDRGLAAEMFFNMLAVWLCDYGSSPRGAFPATRHIRTRWPDLIAAWEAYAAATWGDDLARPQPRP